MKKHIVLAVVLCAAFAFAQDKPFVPDPGLGSVDHPVNTTSKEAQQCFNQGVALLYGFNHDEAKRAFLCAAQHDPKLAMAWWGVAKAVGPNYNLAVDPAREKEGYDAIQKARELAKNDAWQNEREYIEALAQRFTNDPKADLHQLDRNYSSAMHALMQKYPDDLDAATLFSESAMDLRPWRLWNSDGTPAPGTEEIVAVLESVLRRDPTHIGANHLFIHAVEASPHPEVALASAERLAGLAPSAGHLVHMPAHIFERTGFYTESANTNGAAIVADDKYLASTGEQGIYPVMYYTHNQHFFMWAEMMRGRYASSSDMAQKMAARLMPFVAQMPGMVDMFISMPNVVNVRFRRWNEVIKTAEPPANLPLTQTQWHFARGMAFAADGRPQDASKELAAVRALKPKIADLKIDPQGGDDARKVGELADTMLQAAIARAEKKSDQEIALLQQAVAIQDTLNYNEPSDWLLPARESLGGALLRAGKPVDAEKVFREALVHEPRNGRALFGLAEALRQQHRASDAAFVEHQFDTAWKDADTKLNVENL